MSQTVWAPILWLLGHYEISSDGQMRSVARIGHDGRRLSGRLLRLGTRNGYKVAWPRLEGRTICVSIHRLVAEAFIPNPEGKPDVNHKDGDRANNSISNLEWVTKSENMAHAWRIGLCSSRNRARGERHYRAKATEEQVRLIRAGSKESFGLSKSALQHIRKGRSWSHLCTNPEDEIERIERENNELLKALTKRMERAELLRSKVRAVK
jgi:hypothetical protein